MVAFAAAVFACVGIIGSGYVAGRVKLIGSEGSAALGVFLGRFALPALLFTELSTLDLRDIEITLLVSVLMAKVGTFVGVTLSSLTFDFVRGSRTKLLGVSALRAIFCTQSNDFALGLPVMTALFKVSHPQLVSMLYLLSPISLLLLNPLGFLLMGYSAAAGDDSSDSSDSEIDDDDNEDVVVNYSLGDDAERIIMDDDDDDDDEVKSPRRRRRRRKMPKIERPKSVVVPVFLGVLKTPIVASTVLGSAWNLLNLPVPGPMKFMFATLGDGFTPVALFFTGLSLVGKVDTLTPERLMLPGTLAVIKVLILAFIMYLSAGIAGGDADARAFAFVYGAIPTAPSVLVYAHEYFSGAPKVVEQMAVSLVVCTLFATPVLFIAGVLVKADSSEEAIDAGARQAALYLSVPSSFVSVWLMGNFLIAWTADRAKRLRKHFSREWKPADSRVVLLLIIAACHAVGSANAATCFASTTRGGSQLASQLRYAIGSFCRLAACGAAAAADDCEEDTVPPSA